MAAHDLSMLTSPLFLDEIHHLLWVEPAENRGKWDEGWSCRNHALIACAVTCVMKNRGAIIYGKSTFVIGPDGDLPSVGVAADPHSWFGVDGFGYFDLSPRLTRHKEPVWRPWPLSCIAMSRCLPDGDFLAAESERQYENSVNAATHVPRRRKAVYFGQTYANFSRKLLIEGFEAADSPLTGRLSERYDPAIFAKAAIHLWKLLRGEAQSLRGLSQDEAWERIAKQPGDAISWVCHRAGVQ